MRVLVACERNGKVRDAFIRAGHDAISCDLQETTSSGPHYCGDIRDILSQHWDLIIAFPTCTYLTNSGVCHLVNNPERWKNLYHGADFFKLFLNHPCKRIAIENPIPHGYALNLIGRRYSQIIHPWQYGHPEQKATCLWLKNLPPLRETNNVKAEMMKLSHKERNRIHYTSPGPDRMNIRSETFQGIADAMADQWGGELAEYQLEMFE